MALLDIQNVTLYPQINSFVSIPEYKIQDNTYVVYVLKVTIGSVIWTVEKRYSDFSAFDTKRFKSRMKSFLPGKKLVGNLKPDFLNERRTELEKYIQTVVEFDIWLQKKRKRYSLSPSIAHFLNFQDYEVRAIVEDLSLKLGKCGEEWLFSATKKPKYFEFSTVELHAISKRLDLAEPTTSYGPEVDIANCVEFMQKVRNLKVLGSRGYVGTSNIRANSLPFSLRFCKNILSLWISKADVRMIHQLYAVRKTCRRLVIHFSIKKLSDFLLEKGSSLSIEHHGTWSSLIEADFSFNSLEEIDESIRLLTVVSKINFANNALSDIGSHLQHLVLLTELNLSNNNIRSLEIWSAKLGNLKHLELAGNSICSLDGLEKLYSLEYLDLTNNHIAEPEHVRPIGALPYLDHLILLDNPIQQVIEYRTKVLECFGERASQIVLDSRAPNQREVDTISVRLALRKAQEEKEKQSQKVSLVIDNEFRSFPAENAVRSL